MYDPAAVANYILRKAEQEGIRISPMKLQKLIYYCHGLSLAQTGEPLVNEIFESWQYGPVLRSIWVVFRGVGAESIGTRRVSNYSFPITFVTPYLDEIPDSKPAVSVVDSVWDLLKNYSATALSDATHQPGTPWSQVWNGTSRPIPNDLIRAYFEKRRQKSGTSKSSSATSSESNR